MRNRVEETAETSPDVSLHTMSGSIIHANPKGEKQNPQIHTHIEKAITTSNCTEAHQKI